MVATTATNTDAHVPGGIGRDSGQSKQLIEQRGTAMVRGGITPEPILTVTKSVERLGISATPVRVGLMDLSETGVVGRQMDRALTARRMSQARFPLGRHIIATAHRIECMSLSAKVSQG